MRHDKEYAARDPSCSTWSLIFNLLNSADSSQTNVGPGGHKCNMALLNGTMVLNYDILNLAALVALSITGSQKKDILDQRGVQVEGLVELFHNVSL